MFEEPVAVHAMSLESWQLTTPVAVIVFNRPQLARKLYESLRQVKPRKLFVVADGPRLTKIGEDEKCAETRAVFDTIEWDCDVWRNYATENLGCGWRPASGISWVFEQVPEAIILEDDCLPHPHFFRFCADLLEHYRDDTRVAHIGGTNFHPRLPMAAASYHFTRYPLCWGWATWRRAWQHFDYNLNDWPPLLANGEIQSLFDEWLDTLPQRRFWSERFAALYAGDKSHIWDYQWIFACWRQRALSIYPSVNLVSNVGFGDDGTHTLAATAALQPVYQRLGIAPASWAGKALANSYDFFFPQRFANLPTSPMDFPLRHPDKIQRGFFVDSTLQSQNYEGGWRGRIKREIKRRWLT